MNIVVGAAKDLNIPITLTAGQQRAQDLLDLIVQNLEVELSVPDAEVIKQDDSFTDNKQVMYWIGTGSCKVHVKLHDGRIEKRPSLVEGDHFGELSLIYKCARTATVVSENYSTFARLAKSRFRQVISEFPEYEQ